MVEAQTPWLGDGLCTSGDHERGLVAPLCHCFAPRGDGVFLSSHNKRVVHYESMKRKLKIKPIYECRCNERLPAKRFTRLTHTGLVVELEYLKIKTRLTNEKFASVKGECEI
jgi:hypothetical protein